LSAICPSLLVRDLLVVLELYRSCLKTNRDELGPQPQIPAAAPKPVPAEKALPFSEWLFEPPS
jgi:hypothetical protein